MHPPVRIVVMEGPPADYPAKFRAALDALGIEATVEAYPNFFAKGLKRQAIADIRTRLERRRPDELVFFCPGAVEFYLPEPDLTFQFSAYRSWCDPERIIVLPHPWTAVWPSASDDLAWKRKPDCHIGFMGSTYGNSRFARLTARLPGFARQWILEGGFLRDTDRAALLNAFGINFQLMSAFARLDALDATQAAARSCSPPPRVEVLDTRGFAGTPASQRAYAEHLARTTYVLCPRGHENYSWRTYEALRFGRVPVIFDTDMVLPDCIDWKSVALMVPGGSPETGLQIILEDYRNTSEQAFLERQRRAFAASKTIDGEGWLKDTLSRAISLARCARGQKPCQKA